ncbi:hypothetical protein [Phycicoccus sp. Soil803]|uniref:hypothetical protein n=1 Tax=Phycicoccus sp. Soil803 TaxID=1736415 RepID=UPI00070F2888|nr:hypothetical protein [Phycicoccus sp. Soil803]KRF23850.1 hypothetical protein ASG95_04075 [Phycicoccus sp. Soil803]
MNTKRVSIAVAVSALGLAIAPGVASAADGQVGCGTPAKQAVYSTVVVPGTAAVTHEEYEWSSVSEVIEQQWHQWLVDSAAMDAVYETVHHAAEYTTTTVPGTAAYDEQVLDVAAHDEQVLDVAAHDVQVLDVAAHDEQVVDVPAHDVQVLDVAAHDEQVVDVPAHDVQVLDVAAHDEQVVDNPAYDEQVLVTAAYDQQVLVTAAYDQQVMTSPAVYATEYLFVNKNGKENWDTDPNWNANNNDKSSGWVAMNQTRQGALISAAVYTTVHHDAVYTTVHHDAVYTTVHHDATYKTVHVADTYKTVHVDATYKTVHVADTYKTVHVDATYKTVHVADTYKTVHVADTYKTVHVPDTYKTVHHDATPDTTTQVLVSPAWDEQVLVTPATDEVGHWEETWSVESPGAAWSATGETRTVDGETELVWAAQSPGEEWTATGAYRTVEDTPAVPDSSEQVLVSAAVPAGPACEEPVTGDGATVVPEPADPAQPASAVPAAAGLAKPAAVNELAFTGSDPTLLWLGMGFLLAGIGVSAGYRKVAQKH